VRLKKLTLIRPNMGNYRARDAMPPLALAILAARTPRSVEINLFDQRIESVPRDDSPDLVAITVETFTARQAYEIAEGYRSRGIPVVMGGFHPTLLPGEAAYHADAVVSGDAEGVWEQILEDFESGKLKPFYTGGNTRPLSGHPADRSIFRGKKYLPVELVQYGRGCRHSCDFCSISGFYSGNVRTRHVGSVMDEIKTLNTKHLVFFVDDNLYSTREKFDSLLEAVTPLKIRWACQISIDVLNDDDLLDRLKSSGCIIVLVGFESLLEENLTRMKKLWNRNSGEYMPVVRKLHHRGIAVYGTFVAGYDGDTTGSIENSVRFALEAGLEVANFNLLIPTPGSPLYSRLKKQGRLLVENWWTDGNYRYGAPAFIPERMEPDVFAVSCFKAKKKFYSWRSIFSRLFFSGHGFSFFQFVTVLVINLVSKMEIARKQNRALGGK
jgi:radical SAM superfamily enzyme YgiQ (UPF0313 family)